MSVALLAAACARYWVPRLEPGKTDGWHDECLVHQGCPASAIPPCPAQLGEPPLAWEQIKHDPPRDRVVTVSAKIGYAIGNTLRFCGTQCCNHNATLRTWIGKEYGGPIIIDSEYFLAVADDSLECPRFPTWYSLHLVGKFIDEAHAFELESACDPTL